MRAHRQARTVDLVTVAGDDLYYWWADKATFTGPADRPVGIYTPESLRGEYLRKVAPEAHQQELEAGYLKGLTEEAPAVVTLNMRAAAACVNEFIARAFPFHLESNRLYARTQFSLSACEEEYFAEDVFKCTPNHLLARGDAEPLLGLPALRVLAQ
ncbi:hypothetical protein [Candidatus Nitrotoga arctica]|uniref:hypothetical protein n=1 Tax=Candidatus Nitrotoga arctica TaxID=453162 RepID=UPI001EFACA59|nr:hypothetical protein [Candidatus Nitrotoga arctica]